VQPLPSLQGLLLLVNTHAPPEQESVVQALPSLHTIGAPTHWPLEQMSPVEHALLSSHAEPFALLGFEHAPLAGLHVPAVWHWSDAVQTFGLLPTHTPAWQESVNVQALPSEQDAPFDTG
jgi:hypothetical protein